MTVEQPIVRPSEPVRHKITVAEFLALNEAGFFEDRGVELIDGEIYEMSGVYLAHGRTMTQLMISIGWAVETFGGGLEATAPVSAHLDDVSLPEADIAISASGGGDKFLAPEHVRILVEVSSSSLPHDLGPKLRLYAKRSVPEYWVADVNARQIIRFHAPEGEGYRERATFAFGEPVPSATIAGLTVDTARLA
ncbi:Uma2 family endonuclease [Sphingomonas sp.]|jgi:Uma2 family endonuclease|uniref:Uma2 family endonuclease n=1 Tax=Sphingomonas sp. TaxID=28214 RepID=UPI002D7EA703|nr:Uma2 family endonuclease [Sphingomonas sp.]HEU0045785.1 Uma2 family endonuclease [Sphingomonas sp.]